MHQPLVMEKGHCLRSVHVVGGWRTWRWTRWKVWRTTRVRRRARDVGGSRGWSGVRSRESGVGRWEQLIPSIFYSIPFRLIGHDPG